MASTVLAQGTHDLELYKTFHKKELTKDKILDILVQGNIDVIKQLVISAGGTFQYSAGDIAKVSLSIEGIDKISGSNAIERIQTIAHSARPLNDTMLRNSNVIPVHSGQAPLAQGYNGAGVVVGLIDTGIDFTHGDFKDSLGNSRIKFLWDHNLSGAPPAGFAYGREFTNANIDAGQASASTDYAFLGHGTHDASIAAGNGLASNSYKGVAPKSDIIMVALNFGSAQSSVVDGVQYIYAKALAMGKPCVINISIGGQIGGVGNSYSSHDGKDLEAQLINNLMNAHTGRTLVAAVGNDGGNPIHLGYTVTADTNFTMFTLASASTGIDLQLYGSVTDLSNVSFSIGADQMSPSHSFRGRINFSTVLPLNVLRNDTLYNNGNRIGVIQSRATLASAGVYEMEFVIVPDSTTYNWRLITTGSGKFDLWSGDFYNGVLPSVSTMPDIVFYKSQDALQTVCSSFQCLDDVVTVGAYVNRRGLVDYNNVYVFNPNASVGVLCSYSSNGPTRDGRIKPDITSPGDFLAAAGVLALIPSYYLANGLFDQVTVDAKHVTASGTSSAAPSVAGIAALYLQKYPNATALQVKNAITACATQDQFTGSNLPDNFWGYGKANAFTTLTGCNSIGVGNLDALNNSLLIYPNPSGSGNEINISISNYKGKDKTELKIYNTIGELIKVVNVSGSLIQLSGAIPSGIYFCDLIVNGNKITTQKLIILE